MPITHDWIKINQQGRPAAGRLRVLMNALQKTMELGDEIETMREMLTTYEDPLNPGQYLPADPDVEACFGVVTTEYGFQDLATAKHAWDQLNVAWAKLKVDTSITNTNLILLRTIKYFR